VNVYNIGRIKPTDAMQRSGDLTQIFTVDAVDPNGKWLLVRAGQGINGISFSAGERLIPLYSPPTLYSDSVGTVPLASSTITLDSNGRASFFCRETVYDAILSGAGPARFFLDSQGGWARGGLSWVNARDYPGVQDAVNACPTGGTVFFPAGDYQVPSG